MATRTEFLLASGALVVAASATGCSAPPPLGAEAPTGTLSPLAWVRVTPQDRVEILVSKTEMGQGIATGFATIVGDELDARLDQIDVLPAVADERFDDPVLHTALTGGSLSVRNMYPVLRRAGATARAMLISAAAAQWNVPVAQCRAGGGRVSEPGGRSATFGSLASAAAALPVPSNVAFKTAAERTFVGKHVPRFDIPAKVDGSARFGIDTVLPGMRYATVVHPPCFGATFGSVDATDARRIAGVRDVFPIEGGVAVVADTTWHAFAGARALKIVWNEPAHKVDSRGLFAEAATLAQDAGKRKTAKRVGDPNVQGATSMRASYQAPFLAHAALEPINATAAVADGRCVVYAPTQVQTAARVLAAKAAGVSIDAVELHTTYVGGGFGRRLHADYVREVAEIARRHGTPIKMTWTREEDVRHDYYRPMVHSDIRAEFDGAGRPLALEQTVVSASIFRQAFPEYSLGKFDREYLATVPASWGYISGLFLKGLDLESVQGAYDTPYAFPNLLVSYVEHSSAVPVGDMRAPDANWNAYVLETFLDECAQAVKRDPVALRRELLAHDPRSLAVLERVLAISQYPHRALPHGHALGLAFATWLGSYSAQVAEVSLVDRRPKVHRLWIAADIGRVINPDNARAQLEGGALFGLSMAALGKVTLKDGCVQEGNFNDYEVLRMADAPQVEVAVIDSEAEPTGVGELGTPAVGPAVANALFTLTGKRIRALPFSDALA